MGTVRIQTSKTYDPMAKPRAACRVELGEMEELSENSLCLLNIKIAQTKQPIKLQYALGTWLTTNLYTARNYYYDPEGSNIYVFRDGLLHELAPIQNRVVWFQSASTTYAKLLAAAIITTVFKFGSIQVCRMPVQTIQQQTNQDAQHAAQSMIPFKDFLESQPTHKAGHIKM
eukprot:3471403-Ditylum_brightwellii.AAC.1